MAIDLNQIISGYNPSNYGFVGSNSGGWYTPASGDSGATPANPYGSGSPFEQYLAQQGVGMWDPGNASYGRVGMTNQQAFSGLYPGAQILGTGSQIQGLDPALGQFQFFTTPQGATPNADFASQNVWGKDMSSHTGLDNWIEPVGLGLVGLGVGSALAGADFFGSGANLAGGASNALSDAGGALDTATGFNLGGAGTTAAGGSMDFTNSLTDLFGNPLNSGGSVFDPTGGIPGMNTGDLTGNPLSAASDPFGLNTPASTTDIFGNPTSGNTFNLGNSQLPNVPLQQLQQLLGGQQQQGGGTGGGFNLGSLGNLAGSTIPGLLALNYARNQSGPNLSNLNSVFAQMQGNQSPYMQSVLDPIRQQNAATFGQLEQNMGNRGLLGSSLENTALQSFNTSADRALANAGASAMQGSLGMQGNLAGNIAQLQNQAQQQKNQLYGTAFDVLGRGLNPQGYAGSQYINSAPGSTGINPVTSGVSSGVSNSLSSIFGNVGNWLQGLIA